MKIEKQKWIIGAKFRNSEGELEIEVISEKNQSRICRIIVSDFKNIEQALKIGMRIIKKGAE
ncbi:MAG: hypothetical protein M3R17_03060 [Bacteroidota bacterium]|nr:hypothetical protein [Bacteroidota bacterium]